MSFPRQLKDNYMDRFIDGACTTEDGFPVLAEALPLKSLLKKPNRSNKGHVAARQISAAYEEHASIIDSLRRELEGSKAREKALIEEFTTKFKQMQSNNVNIPGTYKPTRTQNMDVDVSFDIDELPMDEMADTARMLKSSKVMEQMEQKRALEDLKRQTDQEMKQLRSKNMEQVGRIQKALREKVAEIEALRINLETVQVERNDYKKKLDASMSSIASSGGSPAALSISEFSVNSPNTSSETSSGDSFVTPLKAPTGTQRHLTPLQRLRSVQNSKMNISTPPTQPMSGIHGSGTGSSVSRSSPNTTGNPPSPEPTSRLDALFQKVTDPNLNSLHNVLQVIENEFEDGDELIGKNSGTKLSDSETEFVERIRSIVRATQKDHEEMIDSLQSELKETNNFLQESESKTSEVLRKIKEMQQENKGLKNELSSAHASVKNKNSLEGMLRMVAVDQKSSLSEHTELKKRIRELEVERDVLLSEQSEAQVENEQAVAALRRVMADVASEKEAAVNELQTQLDSISKENLELKRKGKPSHDLPTDPSAAFQERELEQLRSDARRCTELEKLLEEKEASDVQGLEVELEEAQKIICELEDQLKNRSRESDEMVQLQISELQQKAEGSEKTIIENEVLKATTVKLQDEASKLQAQLKENQVNSEKVSIDLVNAEGRITFLEARLEEKQMESEKLSTDLASAENSISALLSEKEELIRSNTSHESELEALRLRASGAEEVLKTVKDVHARENKLEDELSKAQELLSRAIAEKKEFQSTIDLKALEMKRQESELQNLQNEIIDMKEEKLVLRSKVRETERALEQANRIMSLMQETSDTEGTASKAILDLKQQLYEQQDLHSKLRYCCDENGIVMIDSLDRKVNSTLCLLETGILGVHGTPSIAHLNFGDEPLTKEKILESTLSVQRAENNRILKDIQELQVEKDQETAVLRAELTKLRRDYDSKVGLLLKSEDELKVLQSRLNGYVSDGDTDDDETFSSASLPSTLRRPDADEEMRKMWTEIQGAKEKAEKEAKENAESLANAKMIISSLEQSNQTIVENLRNRLSDSNAAIVSLLDQSRKYEAEAKEFKEQLMLLKPSPEKIENVIPMGNETDGKEEFALQEQEVEECENNR